MTRATRSPIFPHLVAAALLAALAGLAARPAVAHSFDTVVIVPEGAQAEAQDIRRAFLIASEERDGHAGEESDGHLGGLDVYLALATAAEAATAEADILAVPLAGPDTSAQARLAGDIGAVLALPPRPGSARAEAWLAAADGPQFAPFADRFRAATGRAPGAAAVATYLTARRIGAAVREAGGVDDRARLRQLLAQ